MEQQSFLIFGAVLLLAVLSSQAVTDNNVVKVVIRHPHHGSMHRKVTEGQTVILDCSQMLHSYRHVIQEDQYRWRKGNVLMGKSAQLTIKAAQSTQGAYECLALAEIAGEMVPMIMKQTIHLIVEVPSCSVEGQVYTTCSTSCAPTCANPHPNCTSSCVQGCQCPNGSVLDEVTNKCVSLNQCECPPTCSHDYCSTPDNARSTCNLPTDQSHCNIIQCNACYYSEKFIPMPPKCRNKVCKNSNCDKDTCITSWANCISHRMRRKTKCKGDECRTFENFYCFQYPTC